jgi:hypothetical protein
MLELEQLLTEAGVLVNRAIGDIDAGVIGLKEVEDRVLEYVNRVGGLLVDEIVDGVREPVVENRVWVEGKKALYKDTSAMKHISRFGTVVSRRRRGYRIEGEAGRWYPLDEALGIDRCCGFTPLMSYLLSSLGSGDSYARAADQLSRCLGFSVSATAVQHNTEAVGRRLEFRPLKSIDAGRQNQYCDLMVVEVDGTTSPQIKEEEGISGRESLKLPTEYKECNLVVIEKMRRDGHSDGSPCYRRHDRWTGARYGPRVLFDGYVHEAGIAMGQLQAQKVVFIADGAKHNWEIRMNNFPDATEILDVYHALEHLGDYCALFAQEQTARQQYARWRDMMLQGDILQLLHEMKQQLAQLSDRDLGQKQINYFLNNISRMAYDQYRALGYPIGSGVVEGSCKFVIGKRFKGSGMRWKRADNQATLNTRLAELNGELENAYAPRRRHFVLVEPDITICQEGAARA